jgi:phosphoribosyl 1,2-cyclic phosphate phosphodiesterase
MELLFLGTGAAEGYPAIFCNCEACKRARLAGDKDIHSRSSIQLGEKYKIDFPPDSYTQMLRFNLNFHFLRHLLITHVHEDHFAASELKWHVEPFAYFKKDEFLTIYGNESVMDKFNSLREKFDESLKFTLLYPYKEYLIDNELLCIPIVAAHADDHGGCYNYIIKRNKTTILVGFDTGWYPDKTWDFIYSKITYFDVVVLDATMQSIDLGDKPYGHMGFKNLIMIKNEMHKFGIISEDTKFIATHFSHNGGMLYEEMVRFLSPYNIIPAYDGLLLEI